MELAFYNEAQNVWKNITQEAAITETPVDLKLHKQLLDLFHIGEYYYYFFDIQNLRFRYISPEVETVLGFPADVMDPMFMMSLIHPDDQAVFLNHEAAVVDFVKQLPNDKLTKYKMSYDYRIRTSKGDYIRILQQVVTLQHDEHNNVTMTLGIHTNISHLKTTNTSTLSFLGLDGEPSYIDVDVRKVYKPATEIFTKREKEVLHYVLKGTPSIEIAQKLFISKHTVDTHRKNILSKTSARNAMELAEKIVNQGLI